MPRLSDSKRPMFPFDLCTYKTSFHNESHFVVVATILLSVFQVQMCTTAITVCAEKQPVLLLADLKRRSTKTKSLDLLYS